MPKFLHTSTEPRLHYSNPEIGFGGAEDLPPGAVIEAAGNPNPTFFEQVDDATPVTWPQAEPSSDPPPANDPPAEPAAELVPDAAHADIPSASTEEA